MIALNDVEFDQVG